MLYVLDFFFFGSLFSQEGKRKEILCLSILPLDNVLWVKATALELWIAGKLAAKWLLVCWVSASLHASTSWLIRFTFWKSLKYSSLPTLNAIFTATSLICYCSIYSNNCSNYLHNISTKLTGYCLHSTIFNTNSYWGYLCNNPFTRDAEKNRV